LIAGLTALAVAALAFSADARPQTPFATFQALCLDTGADSAKALAAADAIGWTSIPDKLLAELVSATPGSPGVMSRNGRVSPAGGAPLALVVGHGIRKAATTIEGDFCAVSAPMADFAGLRTAAGDFAGSPPVFAQAETAMFAWREAAGVRVPVSAAELNKISSNAGVTVLAVGRAPSGLIIALLAPTK
jgi:hypothetical protein